METRLFLIALGATLFFPSVVIGWFIDEWIEPKADWPFVLTTMVGVVGVLCILVGGLGQLWHWLGGVS